MRSTSGTTFGIAAKLAALALYLAAPAPARAQELVQFGDTITDPGLYVLAGNQSGSGNGVAINTDDVTLLLLRFTLRGDGTGIGVVSQGYDRVTVYGGRVTNFSRGMAFSSGFDCTVKDARIDHCGMTGLVMFLMQGCDVRRVRSEYNGENGVADTSGFENHYFSVLANNNDGDGIRFDAVGPIGPRHCTLKKCWAAYNAGDGIRLVNAGLNELKENQSVGNEGIGIHLDRNAVPVLLGADASDDNEVARNFCVFNRAGIVVGNESSSNVLHENIALANQIADLVDANPAPPCANTWFLDTFLTRDGAGEACIF